MICINDSSKETKGRPRRELHLLQGQARARVQKKQSNKRGKARDLQLLSRDKEFKISKEKLGKGSGKIRRGKREEVVITLYYQAVPSFPTNSDEQRYVDTAETWSPQLSVRMRSWLYGVEVFFEQGLEVHIGRHSARSSGPRQGLAQCP